MKVLLTGYAGFLGRHIADCLVKRGWEARVILHSTAIRRRDLKPGFEIIWGDVTKPETIDKSVQGVDAVIHSAWVWPHSVGGNDSINLDIVRRLMEQSIAAGVSKVAFVSSVAVYGMAKRNGVLEETIPLASGSAIEPPYPRHKVQVEEYLAEHMGNAGKKPLVAVFRPGVLIDRTKGPGKPLSLGKSTLGLGFGNGRNHLPYISAADTAEAIVLWLESGKQSATYNVTPTHSAPAREWYRRWGKRHGVPMRPFFIRPFVILGAGLGITMLKRIMGKKASMLGFRYSMASASRDLRYANDRLKRELGWTDAETEKYFQDA
jgi:nucleoside-diphosphate-sugar epimerase